MFWTVFFAALIANIVGTGIVLGAMLVFGSRMAALYKPMMRELESDRDAELEREEHERELAKKVRNIR